MTTLTFRSATIDATDDSREVLVCFAKPDGRLRNILLRAGSKNAVPAEALTAIRQADAETYPTAPAALADDADDAAKAAYQAAVDKYLEVCAAVDSRKSSARSTFNGIAAQLGQKQADTEDGVDEAAPAKA